MVAWLLAAAVLAGGPEAEGWKKVVDGDVAIYARNLPGERAAAIRGITVMKVTPAEVRAVLIDEAYARRAKYIDEYRTIDKPAPNVVIRYTRLGLPIVDDRDYFIEITREKDLAPDGSGTFHSVWKPWGLDRPSRKGVVRVTINSGYWDVTPADGGAHARVEYYLQFDPGGSMPGWVVDEGNRRILPDVLRGIEKEALRRREADQQAPSKAPAVAQPQR